MHEAGQLGRTFGGVPLFEHGILQFGEFAQFHRRVDIARQFEAVAAGVEEINRFENGVVGRSDDAATGLFQARLVKEQLRLVIDAQGEVLHPLRCVVVAVHGQGFGQLEKRHATAVGHLEKNMHVRRELAGAGDVVLGHGHGEFQVEDLGIKIHRLLRVFAAIGGVMQRLYGHDSSCLGRRLRIACGL